jgi:hypothetical protein
VIELVHARQPPPFPHICHTLPLSPDALNSTAGSHNHWVPDKKGPWTPVLVARTLVSAVDNHVETCRPKTQRVGRGSKVKKRQRRDTSPFGHANDHAEKRRSKIGSSTRLSAWCFRRLLTSAHKLPTRFIPSVLPPSAGQPPNLIQMFRRKTVCIQRQQTLALLELLQKNSPSVLSTSSSRPSNSSANWNSSIPSRANTTGRRRQRPQSR